MPTIAHFEIPSDNLERTKKFYTELFGWKMEKMPGTDQREYWTFFTTTNDRGSSSGGGDGERDELRTVSGGLRFLATDGLQYAQTLKTTGLRFGRLTLIQNKYTLLHGWR